MPQTTKQNPELLAAFWQALATELPAPCLDELLELPEPCRNHLQDRLRRPERAQRLTAGCCKLAVMDWTLFLEGLRLFPHAVCRVAETVGPLSQELWQSLCGELAEHRLWLVVAKLEQGEQGFWEAVELLRSHRELPQVILDFLDSGRPEDEAPWQDFLGSLHRFLLRARLEKVRFAAYAAVKGSHLP